MAKRSVMLTRRCITFNNCICWSEKKVKFDSFGLEKVMISQVLTLQVILICFSDFHGLRYASYVWLVLIFWVYQGTAANDIDFHERRSCFRFQFWFIWLPKKAHISCCTSLNDWIVVLSSSSRLVGIYQIWSILYVIDHLLSTILRLWGQITILKEFS